MKLPPSRERLPLAFGSGLSSGWLKVTISPLIPRPVGPTIDWYGSATTTASLPLRRMQVRPYQLSSMRRDSDTAHSPPAHPGRSLPRVPRSVQTKR